MVGGPAKLSEKGSLVCKHSNEGEPSDDQSKIRGEIPSSGDLVTLPPMHVPNAHTGKCTPGSGTREGCSEKDFTVHSRGCGHTCADCR